VNKAWPTQLNWLHDSRVGLELWAWYFYESTKSARIEKPSPRAKLVGTLKKVWLLYQDDAGAGGARDPVWIATS
jgi:hypothetical protein